VRCIVCWHVGLLAASAVVLLAVVSRIVVEAVVGGR
jgi:hypothetical protein